MSGLDTRLGTAESTISGHTTSIAANVVAPATTTENKVPQWSDASKTLKDGLVVGTGGSNLVQLTSASKIPAVDGSLITGLVPSQIASGNFAVARMPTDAKRTIVLLGSTAEYPSVHPAAADSIETTTNKLVFAGTNFEAGATDLYAQWRFRLPLNYKSAAGMTFRPAFFLKAEAAGSTNLIFGLQALIIGSVGAIDTAWGTAVEVTTDVSGVAANTLIIAAESTAVTPAKIPANLTIVGGEEIVVQVYRKGSDTCAADAVLTDIYLTYTTDKYEDV